jgi:uncharacterized membrane protein (UPF0127 family)
LTRNTLILALALWLSGCGNPAPQDVTPSLPTTTMSIGGQSFVLEKATTPGQQEMGLMRRDSLASDHGMIFIFPHADVQRFWNANVRFGLDNLFLDDDARIVSIQQMKAYDPTNTEPVTARYVIELNTGTAARLGLKIGDQLTLPSDVAGH